MKIIDITIELNEQTPIYEGDPRFQKKQISFLEENGYALSAISMGTHTGTHVDAPSHFLEGGRSLGEISLRRFIGKSIVTDRVTPESVKGYERVLLRGMKKKLHAEQAAILVEAGVRVVGTEKQSIGNDEVHKILLGAGCVVLESLKLDQVELKEYFLAAMPLKIDADGSPIRACLIDWEEEK